MAQCSSYYKVRILSRGIDRNRKIVYTGFVGSSLTDNGGALVQDLVTLAITYGCIGFVSACAIGALRWWDGKRYPICRACRTNEHVLRTAGGPRCVIHGTLTINGGHA